MKDIMNIFVILFLLISSSCANSSQTNNNITSDNRTIKIDSTIQDSDSLNQFKISENNILKTNCDTFSFGDIYKKINPYKNILIDEIPNNSFKKINAKKIGKGKTQYEIKFMNSFNLTYTYYDNFGITPKNDHEYFTLNDKKLFVDSLYYSKTLNDTSNFKNPWDIFAFRSFGEFTAFKFNFNGIAYLAVYIVNSSPGMFTGTCLFLFSQSKVDNKVNFVFFSEQLSEGKECFGTDITGQKLCLFDWRFLNNFYSKYEISGDSCMFLAKDSLGFEYEWYQYYLIHCK